MRDYRTGRRIPRATDEQLHALRAFAARHGRTWKAQLREAWMSGQYDDADDSATLQQIRNTLGPQWLQHGTI
jgi:hypothetical protein